MHLKLNDFLSKYQEEIKQPSRAKPRGKAKIVEVMEPAKKCQEYQLLDEIKRLIKGNLIDESKQAVGVLIDLLYKVD